MAGIRNPREVGAQVAFTVESFDDSERLIDESTGAQAFTITMTKIGKITSLEV